MTAAAGRSTGPGSLWAGGLGVWEILGRRRGPPAASPNPGSLYKVCNCDKYLKISREKMKELMKLSGYTAEEGGPGKCARSRAGRGNGPGTPRPPPGCPAETTGKEDRGPATTEAPADRPPSDGGHRSCPWLEESDLNTESLTLSNGTSLQAWAIPEELLHREDLTHFYCCTRCGKVFWDGSHFGRLVSQFREIL